MNTIKFSLLSASMVFWTATTSRETLVRHVCVCVCVSFQYRLWTCDLTQFSISLSFLYFLSTQSLTIHPHNSHYVENNVLTTSFVDSLTRLMCGINVEFSIPRLWKDSVQQLPKLELFLYLSPLLTHTLTHSFIVCICSTPLMTRYYVCPPLWMISQPRAKLWTTSLNISRAFIWQALWKVVLYIYSWLMHIRTISLICVVSLSVSFLRHR